MSKVILYIAVSVDGYIATKDGGVKWLDKYTDGKIDYGFHKFYKSIDTAIIGSTTYKQILTFGKWPYPDKLNYVITTKKNLKKMDDSVNFYNGSLLVLVKKLKAKSKKNIWLVGGGKLTGSFINKNLIDELIMFIMPDILTDGIPLFQNIIKERKIKLVNSKTYSTGVVELTYKL
ncbi:MAG: riboflavin biosynthesis protein RibD [Parcubacteria group bacterium]|nr:riboflavin biosynthesis protein RibD [Parcubacteria group bacterium]|tara:strand:- start:3217 stop:3741 length:525 start_codon:yes stop_codon:yes gene_type:complete